MLGGVGRDDTVLALDASPGLTDGVAEVRARFAYGDDADAAGRHGRASARQRLAARVTAARAP